jgi:hypothetical protein
MYIKIITVTKIIINNNINKKQTLATTTTTTKKKEKKKEKISRHHTYQRSTVVSSLNQTENGVVDLERVDAPHEVNRPSLGGRAYLYPRKITSNQFES